MKKLSRKQQYKLIKKNRELASQFSVCDVSDASDEYVYHITKPELWDKIKNSGGLSGGLRKETIMNRKEGTQNGYLYVIDSPDQHDWEMLPWDLSLNNNYPTNPSLLPMDTSSKEKLEEILMDFVECGLIDNEDEQYVVLGIKKSWLEENGLALKKDNWGNGTTVSYSDKDHRQIYLGDRKVPTNEITFFGSHPIIDPEIRDQRSFEYMSTVFDRPVEDMVLLCQLVDSKGNRFEYKLDQEEVRRFDYRTREFFRITQIPVKDSDCKVVDCGDRWTTTDVIEKMEPLNLSEYKKAS